MVQDFKVLNTQNNDRFGGSRMDIVYDGTGDVTMINGVNMLNQSLQKTILTSLRDTNLYPLYGSEIRLVIGQPLDDTVVRSFLIQTISEACDRYIEQQEIARREFEFTDAELMDSLHNITIEKQQLKETVYLVTVYINTVAGTTVPISFPIEVGG